MRENRRRRKLRVHLPVVGVIAGLFIVIGVVKFWQPMRTARRQSAQLAHLSRQKAALEQELARLQDRKDRLASDDGQEVAARQEGYIMDGDRRIVFIGEKPKEEAGSGKREAGRK